MSKSKFMNKRFNDTSSKSYELLGTKVPISTNYGGLGHRYYENLKNEADQILQVDAVTGVTETRGSVRDRSIQLALGMKERGVRRNDVIIINCSTHGNQTIIVLAALFMGAIAAPLNPDFSHKESLALVKKLKPKMCFCDSRTVSQIDRILTNLKFSAEVVNFGTETGGTILFSKLCPKKEVPNFNPAFVEHPAKTIAFILPTQGTEGEPKLVCLSHHNVYIQTLNFSQIFGQPDRIISFFPLSWIVQLVTVCASLEYTIVRILPGKFSERSACKLIQDFKVDVAILGTELTMRLVSNVAIRDFNISCLKCVLVGNTSTSKNDMQHIRVLMPRTKVIQAYALAEAGYVAAITMDNYKVSMNKKGSVGRIMNNCRVRIVDLDTISVLGPETYGQLCVGGDSVMLGYFKDSKTTLATMQQGFFKTGDVAKYDNDGWLYIQGRLEDMITLLHDYRFFPRELEDVIISHPCVHDVVVIGNEKDLIACVMKKPEADLTASVINTFLNERVPANQIPTKVIFYNELPRTSTGVVKKRVLRENLLKIRLEYSTSVASICASTLPQQPEPVYQDEKK